MRLKLNNKKYFLILCTLIIIDIARAQQDPLYTQYNFNTQVINPAYAGTWDNMGFVVLGRNQWLGMEGSPKTYTFSMQTNARNKNVGLGLNIISDNIGKEKRLSLSGDYSYGFKVDKNSTLSLGLKLGITRYQNNLTEYLQYPGTPDPLIQGDANIRHMPNFGVGAYLLSDVYYLSLSIPKLIENKFDNYENYSTQAEIRHLYLLAGYAFDLSENVIFKPTFLTRATRGIPAAFDLSANFLLGEKVWLGGMYRTDGAFGFIAQWIFDNKLRIGYAVDFSTSQIRSFQYGGHEVMVSYELNMDRKKWSTPRMF